VAKMISRYCRPDVEADAHAASSRIKFDEGKGDEETEFDEVPD
jgi:hypothetical protein